MRLSKKGSGFVTCALVVGARIPWIEAGWAGPLGGLVLADVMDAVRNFFEERNRTWVTGDARPLQQCARNATGEAWYQRLRKQLAAKRTEMTRRAGVLVRAHSQVQVIQVEGGDNHPTCDVRLTERITWVYQEQGDFSVESRLVDHQQRWSNQANGWMLVRDVESGEGGIEGLKRTSRMMRFTTTHAEHQRGERYDRVRALRYAELWWDSVNPSYVQFDSDDCTNFVSQCLLAGNLRMSGGGNRAIGWWFKFGTNDQQANWSYSWSTANALAMWLTNKVGATATANPQDLKIGDVIFYDWQGNGKYGHSTIVVDFNAMGDPLVNAHTDSSFHRHFQYLDSRAWTPNTRYLFVHVPDEFQ